MRSDNTHYCIYCLRCLKGSEFTREHVLSTAFGTFAKAPVLHKCVCGQCNQFFADELELQFARGAFEGMLRYRTGIKTPDTGAIWLRYVEFTIPDGNDWSGVRLGLMCEDDGLRVHVISQAAFFDSGQARWVHFTIDEIDAGRLSERHDLKKSSARIFAASQKDVDMIASKLNDNGITFNKAGDLNPPKALLEGGNISAEVTFTINRGIRRCIAKYAFNYLAFCCGPEFVLGSDFDIVRNFIRYGDTPPYIVVKDNYKPILRDDTRRVRQTEGHLLTIDWTPSGLDIEGKVSLFNYITYSVSLARHFSGPIWRPIRSGVHFNIRNRTVKPLMPISPHLLPW